MTDHTLKKFFDEAKRRDAHNLPSFRSLLRKDPPKAKEAPGWGWMPFACAAALLIAAALLAFSVLPSNEPPSAAEVEQWAAISEWTASSDVMLAENIPSIGVPLSTSSDLIFESSPASSSPSKNQNL
jgi:hypothetical protein